MILGLERSPGAFGPLIAPFLTQSGVRVGGGALKGDPVLLVPLMGAIGGGGGGGERGDGLHIAVDCCNAD